MQGKGEIDISSFLTIVLSKYTIKERWKYANCISSNECREWKL